MKFKMKAIALCALASTTLSACWVSPSTMIGGRMIRDDVAHDNGSIMQPGHALAEMIAGIWVDGNGCEHWIIDDGIEGYMTTRWGPDGKPYCPAGNIPYQTKGFKRTKWFGSAMATNGRYNVPGEYTSLQGRRIDTGQYSPTDIGGALPYQNYRPNADVNDTYILGGY